MFPLEDFAATRMTGAGAADARDPHLDAEAIEKARLEGYETGYQAGWDDAVRSEAKNQERIGEEFARNLGDLGFTFHEARSHVLRGLEPLFEAVVGSLLPVLAAEALGMTIVEELMSIAAEAGDRPIEIVAASSNMGVLEELIGTVTAVPVRLLEEPTLAEGQVFLRSEKEEKEIDLDDVIERIGAAIRAYYQLNEKVAQNG